MQATSGIEEVLAFAKQVGEMVERIRIDGQWGLPLVYGPYGIEGVDGGFPADAAAGAGVEMTLQFFEVGVGLGVQGDFDGVLAVCFCSFADGDGFRFQQGGVAGDDVFGK